MSAAEPPIPMARSEAAGVARAGVLYGLAAYLSWGVAPLYFKIVVARAPALEVVAHRVLWSAVFLVGLVIFRRQWPALRRVILDSPRVLAVLAGTTMLISINWFVFIRVHETDHVLHASLGYFINPLISVALGFAILRERLRPMQVAGVVLAAVAVAYLTIASGEVPLLALVLATTFAIYGLIRKVVAVEAMVGLTIETLLLAPFCAGYLVWAGIEGRGAFGVQSRATDLLLLAGGIVTALPLLWFTCAARRLRLVTVGFLQYLAPSGQFLIAVLVFREPLSADRLTAFIIIWIALAVYSVDAWRTATRREGREGPGGDALCADMIEPAPAQRGSGVPELSSSEASRT